MFQLGPVRQLLLLACLALGFLIPTTTPTSVSAAPRCSDSAGKSRSMNLSSTVGVSQVKLCADWIKVGTTTTSKPKTQPKTNATGSITLKNSAGQAIVFTNSVVAGPDRPRIYRTGPAQIAVGEFAKFRTAALAHSKYRVLLGVPTEIRFTPIRFFWSLSDGASFSSRRFGHTFSTRGSVQVRLRVEYSIAFRVRLRGEYRPISKTITLAASPTNMLIDGAAASKRLPVYVEYSCIERPKAWGCGP